MAQTASFKECAGCLHFSKRIAELEKRISQLYSIQDDERLLDSLAEEASCLMEPDPPAKASQLEIQWQMNRAPELELSNCFSTLDSTPPTHPSDTAIPHPVGKSVRRRLLESAVKNHLRSTGGSTTSDPKKRSTSATAGDTVAAPTPIDGPGATHHSLTNGLPSGEEDNANMVACPSITTDTAGIIGTEHTEDNISYPPSSPPFTGFVSTNISVCDTLIIGDSLVRQVTVPNCNTKCFPGAKVADLDAMLPHMMPEMTYIDSLVIHVGTNDIADEKSELLKLAYIKLFERLRWTDRSFTISGPLPRLRSGGMKFSRLQQLHVWLKGFCFYWAIPYVDNFLLFYNRHDLYNADGLHLNRKGARLLSSNIKYTLNSVYWEPDSI